MYGRKHILESDASEEHYDLFLANELVQLLDFHPHDQAFKNPLTLVLETPRVSI